MEELVPEIVYWKTKKYRRERSAARRLRLGERTIKGLIVTCKHCKKEFTPRNIRAEVCSRDCVLRWSRAMRVRPNSEERFATRLRQCHHLTLEEYMALITGQGNLCKLCKEPLNNNVRELRMCIDHDHSCCRIGASCNRCRRGIIHQRCNLLLGHAKDRIDFLELAAQYLKEHNDSYL